MIFSEPTKGDKLVPVVCGVILLAFFATIPSMVNDQNRRREQAWQDQGCQMYDESVLDKVPAKCQTYFVDHYQAQKLRPQPPKSEELK